MSNSSPDRVMNPFNYQSWKWDDHQFVPTQSCPPYNMVAAFRHMHPLNQNLLMYQHHIMNQMCLSHKIHIKDNPHCPVGGIKNCNCGTFMADKVMMRPRSRANSGEMTGSPGKLPRHSGYFGGFMMPAMVPLN